MASTTLRIALIDDALAPRATAPHRGMLADDGTSDDGRPPHAPELARCLALAGHWVDLLPGRGDGSASRSPRGARYDLVHATSPQSCAAGVRLKQRLRVPLVVTFDAGAAQADLGRRLVRHADHIVAECPQDEEALVALYGAEPQRVSRVPRGVDLEGFEPGDRLALRQALGIAADEFVMLQAGRLVPGKGIDNTIRALAHLPPSQPVRLLVAGGESAEPDEAATPEIARLRALARQCGVAARVGFVGRRERRAMKALYGAADVFVATPWRAPRGIASLEAMACGTPVIASALGSGSLHGVVDGVTGYLVPPNDPRALAERLAYLQANPALAAAFGRAGMRRVQSRFGWERVAAELQEVYGRVVAAPRSGARRPQPWQRTVVGASGVGVDAVSMHS